MMTYNYGQPASAQADSMVEAPYPRPAFNPVQAVPDSGHNDYDPRLAAYGMMDTTVNSAPSYAVHPSPDYSQYGRAPAFPTARDVQAMYQPNVDYGAGSDSGNMMHAGLAQMGLTALNTLGSDVNFGGVRNWLEAQREAGMGPNGRAVEQRVAMGSPDAADQNMYARAQDRANLGENIGWQALPLSRMGMGLRAGQEAYLGSAAAQADNALYYGDRAAQYHNPNGLKNTMPGLDSAYIPRNTAMSAYEQGAQFKPSGDHFPEMGSGPILNVGRVPMAHAPIAPPDMSARTEAIRAQMQPAPTRPFPDAPPPLAHMPYGGADLSAVPKTPNGASIQSLLPGYRDSAAIGKQAETKALRAQLNPSDNAKVKTLLGKKDAPKGSPFNSEGQDRVYGTMVNLPSDYRDAAALRAHAKQFGVSVDDLRGVLAKYYSKQ